MGKKRKSYRKRSEPVVVEQPAEIEAQTIPFGLPESSVATGGAPSDVGVNEETTEGAIGGSDSPLTCGNRNVTIIKGARNIQIGDGNTMTSITQPGSSNSQTDSSDENTGTSAAHVAEWPALPGMREKDASGQAQSNQSRAWTGGADNYNINVRSDYTQIGDGQNVMNIMGPTSGSGCERGKQLLLDDNSREHTVFSEKTFIMPPQRDSKMTHSAPKTEHVQNFRKHTDNFSRGHFMLIVDKPDHVKHIEALGLVKWLAVFDLDQDSWRTGLLSRIRQQISQNMQLNRLTWQDPITTITDTSVAWISMKGASDRASTMIDDDFKGWRKKVKRNFIKQLAEIERFTEAYTSVTVVVLWPNDTQHTRHICNMIEELIATLSAKIVVVVQGQAPDKSRLEWLSENEEVPIVNLSLTDVCAIINDTCATESVQTTTPYQLPTSDGLHNPGINDQEHFWLNQDLDVIYLQNTTGVVYTTESFKEEENNFCRGGTLPWSWWYEAGPGVVDIERDNNWTVTNYIKLRHILPFKSGVITLYHSPGSGGTTMAQRLIWQLMQDTPCVQLKHRFEESAPDIVEKIKLLHERTHMPVVVLVDGEEKHRVDTLFNSLRDHTCIIIVYVQRFWTTQPSNYSDPNGRFWLRSTVSKKEVLGLERLCLQNSETPKQEKNVRRLSEEVQSGHQHSLFEFGLAVHSFNYKGIHKYVAGYLKLDRAKELQTWHQSLLYLALVYFYGQSSIPCYFFTGIAKETIHQIEDFPDEMKELIVRDDNGRNKHLVRISHYFVAKEILDQLLPFPEIPIEREASTLSGIARKKLADWSISFIKLSGKKCKSHPSYISKIMTKTFISRNNKSVGEFEVQRKMKPKLAPLLEQASIKAPFTERFEIFEQLCSSFPLGAQFKAHLGRLYYIYRPEKEEEAEACMKKALKICIDSVEDIEDIPYSKKLDLMHIHHMYGNMIQSWVAKYTGKQLGDEPKITTEPTEFDDTVAMLLPLVKKACLNFAETRKMTPPGSEESLNYICEIQVRLMLCSFVKTSGRHLHEHLDKSRRDDTAEFIKESCTAVDELFVECFSVIEPDKMDNNVDSCQCWFYSLFSHVPRQLRIADDVKGRRLQIAAIKMKHADPKVVPTILEHINEEGDIRHIVEIMEKNLDEYESEETQSVSKSAIDFDYREWLCAIRHDLYTKPNSIEKVLQRVEKWHDKLKTPLSRFYLFVLKSLLGFGSKENEGNEVLLRESQRLREELLSYARFVKKPKYPREWLGSPQLNIGRLAPGRRFFGHIVQQGQEVQNNDLEIKKGTICMKNDKPLSGYIELDLGRRNREQVRVFFIPARTDDLKGTQNAGARVEFVIGFSLLHGYEAFNVMRLTVVKCPKCGIDVEKVSTDTKIRCPKCRKK